MFDQIPVIPASQYTPKLLDKISENVVGLTYTSKSLKKFATDLGYLGTPFQWDEKERSKLQFELDAIYAHLYGLVKSELEYLLETFPIVKRKDIEKYGAYRSKEIILKFYDEFAWVKDEMNMTSL